MPPQGAPACLPARPSLFWDSVAALWGGEGEILQFLRLSEKRNNLFSPGYVPTALLRETKKNSHKKQMFYIDNPSYFRVGEEVAPLLLKTVLNSRYDWQLKAQCHLTHSELVHFLNSEIGSEIEFLILH